MYKKALLVLCVIGLAAISYAADGPSGSKVYAYYFHGNMRCPTCHKLEQYSKEAIDKNFKDAIAAGELEFKTINVEDRGNEHYQKDYQLYTKSLVLSQVKDGAEVRWENMDKIWEYVGNKRKYVDYVTSGVSNFLKEAK